MSNTNSIQSKYINEFIDEFLGLTAKSRAYLPKPVSVVYQKKKIKLTDKDGNPLRDENGKRITKLGNYITVVMFDDGIQVQVAQGSNDAFDLEKAILYAIAKRAYGKLVARVDKDGRDVIDVEGNGYNIMLKRVADKAIDQDALRAQRDEKRAQKVKESSKKTAAPKKTEKKPVKKSTKKSASK